MLTPHLDNALDSYQWRNWLKMDPMQKFDGFSFWDIQLQPMAQVVNSNLDKGATFFINLQGEMGTSMFGWPGQYSKLVKMVKDTAVAGKDGQASRVKVGFKVSWVVLL